MVNEKYTDEQGACTITGVAPTVTNKDETVNVTLETATIEETLYGSVKFTIQDSSENGIADARITLTNTSTNEEYQNGNGGTGTSGGSTISNLPYGTYSILVTCTGYEDATDEITIDSETQTTKVITLTQA